MTGLDDYVFEPRDSGPPDPLAWERIAAFYDEIEAAKRILACAPDVYERVKATVEASTVAGLFEVVENPWLDDGQVLSIDPALLELPPFELPADFAAPKCRCLNCLRPTYGPGHCVSCAVYADGFRTSMTTPPGIITGLGT